MSPYIIEAVRGEKGLSRLCVQRVILTPRTLFFEFMSDFADDDFSFKIEDVEAVVSLL